jgi:peptidoglycan hydrolase CwlO-like protein
LQVKKWVKEVPVEQIENAITYTVNYINAGNKVGNIGGFLNTMVHTPNLFDKYEEKKNKAKKVTKRQQDLSGKIEVKKAELQQIRSELDNTSKELEESLLNQNPALYESIIQRFKEINFTTIKRP